MIIEHFPVGLLACNCLVIGDERTGKALVIDPGDEVSHIAAVLERHGLKVAAIAATHAHIDHVGGLAALKDLSGAPALLHEADLPLLEGLADQASWLGIKPPPMTTIDRFLGDGARVDFGGGYADVIHTPGHSPGSVSFVLSGDRPVVCSGDTLFAGSIGRTDLWGGSFAQIMESIRAKLLAFGDEVEVIPGHGPSTTIGTERRTNPFLTGEIVL